MDHHAKKGKKNIARKTRIQTIQAVGKHQEKNTSEVKVRVLTEVNNHSSMTNKKSM